MRAATTVGVKRWLLFLPMMSCSVFLGSDDSDIDSVEIDASNESDATNEAEPDAGVMATACGPPPDGHVLVEEIEVSVLEDQPAPSQAVLATGVAYTLRGCGTAFIDAPIEGTGDVEWASFQEGVAPIDDCTVPAGFDLGVSVDGAEPSWGAYREDHVYTQTVDGAGAAIVLKYEDCYYPGNSGSLTVEIFEPL